MSTKGLACRSHKHSSSKSPRKLRRCPQFESLESRQLLTASIYRVNVGGPEIVAELPWTADLKGQPSAFVNAIPNSNSDKTATLSPMEVDAIDLSDTSIPRGTPASLFLSERYDWNPPPTMQWTFPVEPGKFEVRLFFAETYSQITAAQQRIFDVVIEGNKVLDNYDIFADVGSMKAVMKSFVVTSDSLLDIEFGNKTQFPTVKAIEIVSIPTTSDPAPINFAKSLLSGASISKPTSLQFGPDGRLYVAQQNGLIKAFTIQRRAANDFVVTATEEITLVQQIPNHDDDGSVNQAINTRLVTGLLVTGTAQMPMIYASSSDPRIGAGPSGTDLGLDTNSGVVSRLTKNGGGWTKLDLVRGLPRSEENHTSNGLQWIASSNTLLIAQGGNTNMGAPSGNFALLPEYALSAAILSVDLTALGESTYDLPTLDDEDRDGVDDLEDPFGGNNGKNQAKLVVGGPVQIYAPGFRNPYDVLVSESGQVYSIDNGPNAGWGAAPLLDNQGRATNVRQEPGAKMGDSLHHITHSGYYGGHPNPTRANPLNTFNSGPQAQSPVSIANPQESIYLSSTLNTTYTQRNDALFVFGQSTNGLAEYTSSRLGGQLKNDLIAVSFDNTVKQITLNSDGTSVLGVTNLFSNVGTAPLDVTTVGDDHPFAGSIWVADHTFNGKIIVFDPILPSDGCLHDDDCDGYTNDDEIANGTDHQNHADVPADFDNDFISDLLDLDDDNDSINDLVDSFVIDSSNGFDTPIGTFFTWENDESSGKLLDLGFTGVMTNGLDNYSELFDPSRITASGAAGVLTLAELHQGTAVGAGNSQTQSLQWGFNASAAGSEKYVAKTSVIAPFNGVSLEVGTEFGFYLGRGDQDNFVQLVISGKNGGQIRLVKEVAGVSTLVQAVHTPIENVDFINLDLVVDPVAKSITAVYQKSVGGKLQAPETLSRTASVPASWFSGSQAIGIIGSDKSLKSPVSSTWDFLGVVPYQDPSQQPSPATVTVNITTEGGIHASTYNLNSIVVANNSTSGGPSIQSITFDLSKALLPDLVFDPVTPAAGDTVTRELIVSSGASETGFISPVSVLSPFSQAYQGGYRNITLNFADFDPGEVMKFAVDIDPTSLRGLAGRGADWPGSISGIELSGTTITTTFSDDTRVTGTVFASQDDNQGHGIATLESTATTTPNVTILGIESSMAKATHPNQTVRVSGDVGAVVFLLAVEGSLESAVFDVDPFEANNVLAIQRFKATIGPQGWVDIPVTIAKTVDGGGLYHFVATVLNSRGVTGAMSNKAIVQFDPAGSQEADSLLTDIAALDVNGDNQISAADALVVMRSMAISDIEGTTTLDARTDVSGDGKTTAADALMIINYIQRAELSSPRSPVESYRGTNAIPVREYSLEEKEHDDQIDLAIGERFPILF